MDPRQQAEMIGNVSPLISFNQNNYISKDEAKSIIGFCLPLSLEFAHEFLFYFHEYKPLQEMFKYLAEKGLPAFAKSANIRQFVGAYKDLFDKNQITNQLHTVITMLDLIGIKEKINVDLIFNPLDFVEYKVEDIICSIRKNLSTSNVFLINFDLETFAHTTILIYDKQKNDFYFFDSNAGIYKLKRENLHKFFINYKRTYKVTAIFLFLLTKKTSEVEK